MTRPRSAIVRIIHGLVVAVFLVAAAGGGIPGRLGRIPVARALNQAANWDFNGNATGWTAGNGSGTAVCGGTGAGAGTSFTTFAYNGSLGGQTAFSAVTSSTASLTNQGMVTQTFAAPGTGTVKAKGTISYYGNATYWGGNDTSWIRLDVYDATNTTHVATIFCASFNSNQAWTTASLSSDVTLTGGTTYTIRATLHAATSTNSKRVSAVTLGVDNILITAAPVGLTAAAPADTTNAQLDWTASTAGSGANGLHASTPYKVYRDAASPVSTFLANATTNAYTDTSTTGNTTYHYAVSNVDTGGTESPLSAETSLLTRPGAPTAVNFANIGTEALRVQWTAPTGGAASYKVDRCQGDGCSNFSEIRSGETNVYYDDSGLSCNTLYRYRVRGTNATGDGAYSSIADQTTAACGALTVDIVDSGGTPVASPSLAMGDVEFSFNPQTATGAFGIAAQKIRVTNTTATPTWTLSLAAAAITVLWDSAGTDYDFNDPTASAGDGGDADSVGGQMTIDASAGTLAPQDGCATTGLTKGGATAFNQGVTDTITLVTAGASAATGCYWDLTGVAVSQTIPDEQPAASDYDLNMVLSIAAS